MKSSPINNFETSTPLGLSVFFEKLMRLAHNWFVLIESNDLFPVVSAAISDIITSNLSLKYPITISLVFFSKISFFTNFTFFIGSISLISTDNIFPLAIILVATCDHPPGEDPKSNKLLFFFINLNFLFNSINLKEARERYPSVLDFLKNWSLCCLIFQELLFLILFDFFIIKYLRDHHLIFFLNFFYLNYYKQLHSKVLKISKQLQKLKAFLKYKIIMQ